MDEALLKAYRRSDYRVRLRSGGAAIIRIGEPLPMALRQFAGHRDWGFLTAWNPRSKPQSPEANRKAQRRLLAELQTHAGLGIYPAVGTGTGGWREPSFWIVGAGRELLDQWGDRYDQNAWLLGHGAGAAELRLR